MQDFSEKRLEGKFRDRLAKASSAPGAGIDRFDLKLWDHGISGPHSAHVLVGFSPNLGIPTKTEIDEWVIRQTQAQMRIVPESVRLHPDEHLIVAEVIKIPQVRPLEHKADMIPVSANAFMDEKEALWEVRKSEGGPTFLARIEREDIDAILKEREKYTKTAGVANRPRLANLHSKGILDPNVGDHVTFLKEGQVYYGQVVAKTAADKVKIALDNTEVEVMTPDIFDVKETTEDFKLKHKQDLINIFTQIYGDRAFATELVTL